MIAVMWFRSPARIILLLGSLLASAQAHDRVVLQLKWRHQFQFAGYYAAIEQGYYKEAGLEVELREAEPGHDPLENVLSGQAQYGVGTSNVILARAAGDPIVVLAVIYQHSPFVLLASKDAGVHDIHDLATKTILMEPDAAELLAYFESEGVDSKKLQLQHHTFDVQQLIEGKAAAMSAYSTDEPFHMKQAGEEYLIFSPRAGGIDFYGDNLFTTEGEIEQHPERVKAFVQASLKGWEYAMAHPEEMIALIQKKYPRGKTDEQLQFEAWETTKLIHPELIEVGYINPGRWKAIAETYQSLGMLPKNFSLDGFLYERTPWLKQRWLYWAGGGLVLAAIGSFGWAMVTLSWNRKLRKEVTARQEAEARAIAESAAKTHFYAILAHEVRTPLSGILSSLWLLQYSQSHEEREELLDICETSAKNLLDLVDHILDHSKIEANRMRIESVAINLPKLIAEVVHLFQAAAVTKGIKLTDRVRASTPEIITTDPLRLQQILANLVSNAIKFTSHGSVEVESEMISSEESDKLILRVRDTGPGIAPDRMDHIFEPYAQENVSTARTNGGTGLGLSIASRLAKLLGGTITAESEAGRGAVFTLTLDLGKSQA